MGAVQTQQEGLSFQVAHSLGNNYANCFIRQLPEVRFQISAQI